MRRGGGSQQHAEACSSAQGGGAHTWHVLHYQAQVGLCQNDLVCADYVHVPKPKVRLYLNLPLDDLDGWLRNGPLDQLDGHLLSAPPVLAQPSLALTTSAQQLDDLVSGGQTKIRKPRLLD